MKRMQRMHKVQLFFGAIFIAITAFFFNCSPNGIDDVPDKPNDTIAVVHKDSLVIEITLNFPAGTILVASHMKFWDEALANKFIDEEYKSDKRFWRYVFYDKDAQALVGTECKFLPIYYGSVNGYDCVFDIAEKFPITFTLKKMNRITFDIIATRGI